LPHEAEASGEEFHALFADVRERLLALVREADLP